MQSLPCMSYSPGKWDSLCPFYRWGCGVFKEGPSQGPDPGWSGSEACALDPEDTFCPWPATAASFEGVAALVPSWPWEKGVLFSPAGGGRVLKHTGSVECPGPPWGVTHTATGRPGFLTALAAAAPPTRPCRAVLRSDMCQQPALPQAWLILSQSQKQGPAWAGSPWQTQAPLWSAVVKRLPDRKCGSAETHAFLNALLPLEEGPRERPESLGCLVIWLSSWEPRISALFSAEVLPPGQSQRAAYLTHQGARPASSWSLTC